MNQRGSHGSIVHIGFHKTGSTSIQHFLKYNRERLHSMGIAFYCGRHIDDNHVELHVASMRQDRLSTFKKRSGLTGDPAYQSAVRSEVEQYASEFATSRIMFSAEGLSLLRYDDETKFLKSLLPSPVQIIAYLREPKSYLASHAREIERNGGTLEFHDKASYTYMQPDSWLVDYEARLARYRKTFGEEKVRVIDYDREEEIHGSVIPSFLDCIGIGAQFAPGDWQNIRKNQHGP